VQPANNTFSIRTIRRGTPYTPFDVHYTWNVNFVPLKQIDVALTDNDQKRIN
jgi:hypothetical protein